MGPLKNFNCGKLLFRDYIISIIISYAIQKFYSRVKFFLTVVSFQAASQQLKVSTNGISVQIHRVTLVNHLTAGGYMHNISTTMLTKFQVRRHRFVRAIICILFLGPFAIAPVPLDSINFSK